MGASKGAVSGQGAPSSRFLLDLSPLPPSTPASLDAEQARVVAHTRGPLLVLAGPGTGKTTTIVEAVAARLSAPQAPLAPSEILVLTFGKRAAGELRDRLVARIGGGLVPTVATFHSFAYGVIRETADDYLISPRLMSGAEEDVRIRELLLGSVEDGVIAWPDDLAAALPRIEARLAKLNPAPTRRIPILIGGGGEKKTLRLVAKHADIWHGFTNAETYPGKAAVLDGHCDAVGRDPAAVERSSGVEGRGAETLIANAEALARLGVTLMTVGCDGPDYDLGPAEALIRWRDSRARG
jgi:hypothetical protein